MYPFSTSFRKYYALLFLLVLSLQITISKAQAILIPTERYQIDANLKLIICHQVPEFPVGQSLPKIRFDKEYSFTQPISSFDIGQPYIVKTGAVNYTLFFTHLPLIRVNTTGKKAISETDDRTKGTFSLTNGTDPLFTSSMGIRIRGNASRLFPKKQYNIQLWKDVDGNEELEKSLLNLRKDSKWLLMAMYNEPLRLHNATSQAIWLKMHKLYYLAAEPDANSAIRTKYCDVFVNDSYAGIYMLAEDLDRKQLKLKKSGSNGEIKGELYKTAGASVATGFNALPAPPANPNAEVWAMFEMDYPDPYWNNLYDLLNYAIKSPASEFKAKLSEKFRVDNLIDYYIFLNLIYATDHWGNNQFLARYKENEPYFLIPWDLDGTFGYTPTGARSEEARRMYSNGLFDRLLSLDPDGFKSKMRTRWFELRKNDFSLPALKAGLAVNFNLLTSEGAYAREVMKWPGSVNPSDFPTANTWIENRLAFLDEYFSLFPEETSGINLSYFKGEAIPGSKKLTWAFHQGTDAKKIDVEHSANGVEFSHVETKTVSELDVQPYQFIHSNPASLAFYRLKIIADDDSFIYSSFVQIGENTCPTPPSSPVIQSSRIDIEQEESVVLTASGCTHTVVWSTGQTGSLIVVKPSETTSYSAKCRQAPGCESPSSTPIQINVFSDNSIPGNYEGYLGIIDCGFIRGWAWDKNKPNTPLYIDILDGQQVIGTTVAGIFRQDLKNAGKGNGSHSYIFTVPETVKDNRSHQISTRIRGTEYTLRDSPKRLICEVAIAPSSNQSPVAPVVSALSAKTNTLFNAVLPAFSDPDSPALTYTLTGLPADLNFMAGSRTISGTPTATATLSLTYTASDGPNSSTMVVALTIVDASAPPANLPPVKPAVSPLSATATVAFTATLPAFTDPESAPLSYSLAGLPSGLTFAANTRIITGTPTATATLSLTYTASDGTNSSFVTIPFTIVTKSTSPVVTGSFEGYLDKVECGTIRGWVWDRDKPNTPLTVEFFANGQSIGTTNADIFRQDIKNAGKGNGYHVYSFTTPQSVKTGQTFSISAKVQNSTYTLKDAPKNLICAPNSRLSVSADEAVSTDLIITPNPSNGEFEVIFHTATQTTSELSVVDELGRSWYKKTVEGIGLQRHKILLSGAIGTLVVGVRQGQQIRSKKILIVR